MNEPSGNNRRPPPVTRCFELDGLRGEIAEPYWPEPFASGLRRLLDPANASETIHWGRNYLYRMRHTSAHGGTAEVVVKQFRDRGLRARIRHRFGGTKARRSWQMAHGFEAAGLATAPPVAVIESAQPEGPAYFITRHLAGSVESRYLFRAMNAGTVATEFPEIDPLCFLDELGRTLARMHSAGFFHRDLSIGNVLLVWPPGSPRGPQHPPALHIIDLNRCRRRRRLGLFARTRDLCRLSAERREHQHRLLAAYWHAARGRAPNVLCRVLFVVFHRGFRAKLASKRAVRAVAGRLWALAPRSAHAHIPAAPKAAGARDKIVWDPLSDQPHQHASRIEKLAVRLADSGSHLRAALSVVGAAPRIVRRYRQIMAARFAQPVAWPGVGICVRPYPRCPEALLAALRELGAEQVLLRLEPWREQHDDEEALARALDAAGYEVSFVLAQNRALVKDPARWRAAVEELVARFVPFGQSFQIGQAVNRSKWGIWRPTQYLELAAVAADILRRCGTQVRVLGPAVIDFELHATAALVNAKNSPVRFDALASLLYVDRRGAPENTQLGFDTVRKVALCRAIAETARYCGPQSWITEVNWPLWEGPHSPAGRTVSVDEATQAHYLARFFLLALSAGLADRVFWWQLIAPGYGLIDPRGSGGDGARLRRRPSFHALATLRRQLAGARFLGPLPSPAGTYLYRFADAEREEEVVVAWTAAGRTAIDLPAPLRVVVTEDGREHQPPAHRRLEIGPAVRFARLAANAGSDRASRY